MMKHKNQIAIPIIIAGLLLASCGKDANTENPDEASVSESIQTEEKAGPAQNQETDVMPEGQKDVMSDDASDETSNGSAEAADELSDMEKEVKTLHLIKDCKYVSYTNPDTYVNYMEYEDEKVILSEEDAANYPALAVALEKELNNRNTSYQSELDALIKSYEDVKEKGNDAGFKVSSKISIERADCVVLSICDSASDYTGGDHGNYDVCGYNYDTETGQILKFSDVVVSPVEFLKLADEKIQKSCSEEFETPSRLDDFFENYDTSIIWTIDYQGVKIYFNTYTLGSYALGMIETEIYFSEAPELFASKYLNLPQTFAMKIRSDEPSYLPDINSNGHKEKITISSLYDEEYSYVYGAKITIEDRDFSFDGTLDNCYFVSAGGKNYIFACLSNEGDYKSISSIDLTTMEMDPGNDTEGFLSVYNYQVTDDGNRWECDYNEAVFTDPNKVMLSTYIQYLGTMRGRDYYHMGDSHLVEDTGVYYIDTENVLTANMDIDCELVDIDGNVTGKTVIPEGMKLVVRRGDGRTFADLIEVPADADITDNEYYEFLNSELKLEDADAIYRVMGELNEYGSQAVINGLEEYEVFDRILYSD